MEKGMKHGIVMAVWWICVEVALIVAAVFQRRLLEALAIKVGPRVETTRRLTVDQFGKPMMDLFSRARHRTHTQRMVLPCVLGIPPLSV